MFTLDDVMNDDNWRSVLSCTREARLLIWDENHPVASWFQAESSGYFEVFEAISKEP